MANSIVLLLVNSLHLKEISAPEGLWMPVMLSRSARRSQDGFKQVGRRDDACRSEKMMPGRLLPSPTISSHRCRKVPSFTSRSFSSFLSEKGFSVRAIEVCSK